MQDGRRWLPARAFGRLREASGEVVSFALIEGRVLRLEGVSLAEAARLPDAQLAPRLGAEIPGGLPARLEPPLEGCRKIVALGRSFPEHAMEFGNAAPEAPIVFGKLAENARGCGHPVAIPYGNGERCDNEVELGVVMGADCRAADEDEARAAIAGWTVSNDLTWRSEQFRARDAGEPWFLAKNLPGAHPVGPWIVPRDALDVGALAIRCRINGAVRQEATMAGLMWGLPRLLSWLSHRVPLLAGDLVSMGTPKGVTTVVPGDLVEAEIEGIGVLSTRIEERSW